MSIKIALAGNPNSGKTTMFNDLTGSSQYVGNWPGVTVEKKEGKLRSNKDIIIQDLPGIYSLSPYTLEEVVSRNYLIGEKPDALINIVDASNIERNLYLTTQLAEIGVPMVLALNMIDIVRKNGDTIDSKKLGKLLGCEVVEASALKGIGSKEAAEKAIAAAQKDDGFVPQHTFSEPVEQALAEISSLIEGKIQHTNTRWYAIKLFERDQEVLKEVTFDNQTSERIEAIIVKCETELDDESESIITGERYNYIAGIMQQCVRHKNKGALSTSDKIDKIVTNRILALPIFAVVMWLVYFISISTVGTAMTDWVNDGLFGDGYHLFGIGAAEYEEAAELYEFDQIKIEAYVREAEANGMEVALVSEALEFDAAEFEDETMAATAQADADAVIKHFAADAQASGITAEAVLEDEEGHILRNVVVKAADFVAAVTAPEPDPADFGKWTRGIPVVLGDTFESINVNPVLSALVLDGIVAGVGAVLGFLPQMLVLFLCLSILEDCGYMSRIAFIMDRIFRKFGLSGKSFIPMLVAIGCGVPGVMASRTIENDRDRRMTVMTTTFMPCGAKLPIIGLIAGAMFSGSAWVASSAYFIGIAAIIISGIMLKKTKMFAGDPAPFVMELPAYHLPGIKGVLRTTFSRGWSFVKKAGTIVLLATIGVWFLSSFNWSMEMVDTNDSILAAIGSIIAPLFAPLGWGNWKAAVATVTGLIAKENVVGTFGVLYGFAEVAENGDEIWSAMTQDYTQISAYSFLIFNLLCAPCFAAIGAIRREMMSGKWTWFAIAYQCGFAYVISLLVYQFGKLFTGQGFGIGTIFAVILLAGLIYGLVRKPYQEKDHSLKEEKKRLKTKV